MFKMAVEHQIREFHQGYNFLLRAFFIFLSVLGIEVGDLEYPPTPGAARILESVVIDADQSRRLRLLVKLYFYFFNQRRIHINKILGSILYLLIQASLVQAQQTYILPDDALSKSLNGS